MQPNRPDEIFFDGEIYESQPYASQQTDIPFWIDLAKMYGPKVLELACGTGRITLPLYESGVDIDGLDFSESMLRVARDRSVTKSLPINFILGDIRTLSFHDQYDLIFLPSGTISHLITRPDLESFFSGARSALRQTGVLALDVHNPAETFLRSWPLNPGPEHTSFEIRGTKKMVRVETTQEYYSDTQILTVKNHYTFPDGSTKDGTIVLKLFFPAELQWLLHYNGFDVVSIFGDYSQAGFNAKSKKYVIVARKRR
jgi:SAM-dependent methyltransferase